MSISTPAKPTTGRREEIVQAAATVLGRHGYTDTSLKDVAREAGVAPGLLHYYFHSKEDLLIEVVADIERQLTSDWRLSMEPISDPLERLVAVVDHAARRCSDRPEFFRLLFDLNMLSLSNPGIRERCREIWSTFIDDIEAEIRQVLGQLPAYSVVPPRDLAVAVAGAIDGIALASIVQNQSATAHYHALKVLLLSVVVTAYVTTGQQPPLSRLRELLTTTAP